MSDLSKPICAGILVSAVLSLPCHAEGRWGAEVSPSLTEFGLIKSLSAKNELLVRLECDWTEYVRDDREGVDSDEEPDTTYERRYSEERDDSQGWLSLEAGFRRFFGSGKGLSPHLGVAVRVSPNRSSSSYEYYEENNLAREYEYTSTGARLSVLLNAGCRYLFAEHFALGVHYNVVSYAHTWADSEVRSKYWYENGDMSTHTDEYSRTSQYLQSRLRPSVYLQYYF